MKNIRIFIRKFSYFFLEVKFSIYLNRHVFVMFIKRFQMMADEGKDIYHAV